MLRCQESPTTRYGLDSWTAGASEKIVQGYARPGDLIKELLGKRLRAADDRIQELAPVITGENSAGSFVDQLVTQALHVVDRQVSGWTALANGDVTRLTPSILDELSIPQTARANLEALLDEKLVETSDALGQEVKTQLASALENDAGPEIVDFLNALSSDRHDAQRAQYLGNGTTQTGQ